MLLLVSMFMYVVCLKALLCNHCDAAVFFKRKQILIILGIGRSVIHFYRKQTVSAFDRRAEHSALSLAEFYALCADLAAETVDQSVLPLFFQYITVAALLSSILRKSLHRRRIPILSFHEKLIAFHGIFCAFWRKKRLMRVSTPCWAIKSSHSRMPTFERNSAWFRNPRRVSCLQLAGSAALRSCAGSKKGGGRRRVFFPLTLHNSCSTLFVSELENIGN